MSYNCDPAFTAAGQHTETLRLRNEKFLERGSVLGGAAFHRPLPPARTGGAFGDGAPGASAATAQRARPCATPRHAGAPASGLKN